MRYPSFMTWMGSAMLIVAGLALSGCGKKEIDKENSISMVFINQTQQVCSHLQYPGGDYEEIDVPAGKGTVVWLPKQADRCYEISFYDGSERKRVELCNPGEEPLRWILVLTEKSAQLVRENQDKKLSWGAVELLPELKQ